MPQHGWPWRPVAAAYLVFDPTTSLHCDVIWFPDVPPENPEPSRNLEDEEKQCALEREKKHLFVPADEQNPEVLMEWPTSLFKMVVFSSRTVEFLIMQPVSFLHA